MLQLFAFDRVGIVIGDIYFEDPEPGVGQEGLERGVRLELRLMSQLELDQPATIYASQPILIGEPLWRLDLLEAAGSPPGSFDRTHHHPDMTEWEPSDRVFDQALSGDPLGWLTDRLNDVTPLLTHSDLPPTDVADCIKEIRDAAPEIVAAVRRLLDRVWQGVTPVPAPAAPGGLVRTGWL
jgi:hypothetical protein